MKMVCEFEAASKEPIPCKSVPDEDDKKDWLSSATFYSADTHFDKHEIINIESDDEEDHNASNDHFDYFQAHQNGDEGNFNLNLDQKSSDPSLRGAISLSSGPIVKSEPISFDPREKSVKNIHGPSSLMIGQEPPMKKQRILSEDLHMRFLYALKTAGGLLEATPKKILNCMQVPDLTEDDITSHLLNFRLVLGSKECVPLPLPPSENTRSGFSQDVLKTSDNLTQSGPVQMPLHKGESSNTRMAAAAKKANGGWKLVTETK